MTPRREFRQELSDGAVGPEFGDISISASSDHSTVGTNAAQRRVAPALDVDRLCVDFLTPTGRLRVVDGISLQVMLGQTLAIVGESGCGKSVLALSIMRLLADAARIAAGRILLDGIDVVTLPEREVRCLRGNRMAMIFQEPMTCLNPTMSVGRQITEVLERHNRLRGGAARSAAIELLDRVGISDPQRRVEQYPHELSGGMRQRVMIAIAVACKPALLIADEPTTALDVTIQAQILTLLRRLQQESGMALLLITHDFGVVSQMADDVAVMYAGRVVERAPVAELFDRPLHPYTQALLRCRPRRGLGGVRLETIPGAVPPLEQWTAGCRFEPRCNLGRGDPRCIAERPALDSIRPAHHAACWKTNA